MTHPTDRGAASLAQDETATQDHVPTSVQLAQMLDRAEAEAAVSIGWLMEQLGGRSFGLALLVMGVLGIVPGISTVAALMVVWIAVQMMLGQEAAGCPAWWRAAASASRSWRGSSASWRRGWPGSSG